MKKLLLLLTFMMSKGLIAAPIHDAVERGDIAEVERLIRDGADVNHVDHERNTPLYLATWHKHPEIAKLLVENGADVNAINLDGMTPLCSAVCNGQADIVKMLLKLGANVNGISRGGMTSLHGAAFWNDEKIVKMLIKHGANVNAINDNGCTPMHRAASWGNAEVIRILLEDPLCDHTIANLNNETPEEVAHSQGHQDIANLLHNAPSVIQKLVKSERNDVLQRVAARVANKNGVYEEDYNQIGPCLRHCITNIIKNKKPSSLTDQSVNEDEAGPSGYHSDDEELQHKPSSI